MTQLASTVDCRRMGPIAGFHVGCFTVRSLSLQENAILGDHIWMDTNESGDFCYLSEKNCVVVSEPSPLPAGDLLSICTVPS